MCFFSLSFYSFNFIFHVKTRISLALDMSSFFKETQNFLGSINKLQEREGFEIEVRCIERDTIFQLWK